MKNNVDLLLKSLLVICIVGVVNFTNAQVGIGTENPNATLDVVYKTGSNAPPGVRAPNLKLSELNLYLNSFGVAQKGAFVYITLLDMDTANIPSYANINAPGYYFFDGAVWNVFAIPQMNTVSTEPWYSETTNLGATQNNENIYQNAQVGIGFSGFIDPNAQLEIKSNNKGLIIPRLSNAERNAIASPTTSMLIWNTDELCFNFYKNTLGWKSLCENQTEAELNIIDCQNSLVGGQYTEGVATTYANYIQLNINVTKPGRYTVEGTTSIGLYFQRSGTFTSTGSYVLTIPAYGSPTTSGSANVAININDASSGCVVPIPVIAPATVTYHIAATGDITYDAVDKGVPTTGKKITVSVNATVPGTTNLKATDQSGVGLVYYANNIVLISGTNTFNLYSNGATVPSSFTGSSLPFKLEGLGFQGNQVNSSYVSNFNMTVGSSDASATCSSIVVNGKYVIGQSLSSTNTLTVTVNVTQIGAYTFYAENVAANVKFTANGGFTRTGLQTFTATASPITGSVVGAIDSYVITPKFNGVDLTCNFNLDVIYSSKKILLIGTNSAYTQQLLNNTTNFGPTGSFKIDNLETRLDGNANLTVSSLLEYINNQKYQVIVFPVGMGSFSISSDVQQVLANFITKKKGIVLFLASYQMESHVKGLLDKLYPGNSITTTATTSADTYAIHSTILPYDNTNPYINGPFGNLGGKYFLGYNPQSWLGTTSALPSTLRTLVNLPTIGTNRTRNTFIYTATPGLFVFPGYVSLYDSNNAYGYQNPISANTATYRNTVFNGTSIDTSATLPIGSIVNYLLLGNTFSESFKYLQSNYSLTSPPIDANP